MPEGDTIFKLARRLRGPLLGAKVTRAWGREQGEIRAANGAEVAAVTSRGKHLLIDVAGGWSFHVHLGIAGRCGLYDQDGRRRNRGPKVTGVVETTRHVAVFYRAPKVRLERTAHLRADPSLRFLGPDLLAADFDLDQAIARLRKPRRARMPIGEALLDQGVAAGIGNAFKSDLMFDARIDPWTPVEALDDATLRALYLEARRLLQNNLGGGRRVTVPEEIRRRGSNHWVYDRTHKPCFRCGQPIHSKRQASRRG